MALQHNKHIGKMAAVTPQKVQCEIGNYYPARTLVGAATSPICRPLCTMLLDDITLNAKQYESKENFDLGF